MVKWYREDGSINWPTTDTQWCEWFKALDSKYNTLKHSPLHHDNRCTIHIKE